MIQGQERARVPGRESSLLYELLNVISQFQKTQVVRYIRSVTSDGRCEGLLRQPHRLDQFPVSLRFFDRVQILALNVFNQRNLDETVVRNFLYDDWHSRNSCQFGRPPPSLTGDQFIPVAAASYQ